MKARKDDTQVTITRAGWPVTAWCAAAGIGRSTYYALPKESKPRSTKIGDRHIVIESPVEYLERIAKRGGVQIPKKSEEAA